RGQPHRGLRVAVGVLPALLAREYALLREGAGAAIGEAHHLAPHLVLLLAGHRPHPLAQLRARVGLEGVEGLAVEPVRLVALRRGLEVLELARQLVAELARGPVLARVDAAR